jgi:hypothetical protein
LKQTVKPEDNERLVRVGSGTPMGTMLRRYWQPVLMSSELPEKDGAPVRVRILAEDLIAFRDTEGRVASSTRSARTGGRPCPKVATRNAASAAFFTTRISTPRFSALRVSPTFHGARL